MMWRCGYVLLLATVCLGQRQYSQQGSTSGTGDRQIKLEDIERDNLAASQKPSAPVAPASQQSQQPSLTQQQLAAYQQQLLLQQLQQQYFAPSPLAYGNLGGVPLMIIPSNHLGVGGPPLPIQAFFVPAADPSQYLSPYNPQLNQYFQSSRYQQPQTSHTSQRVPSNPATPDLTYNALPQSFRQPHNFPSASIVYAGTPLGPSLAQPQAYQQQYNAYNALYQQQDKNSFAAGVKSTPTPPLKPQNPSYSQQPSVNNPSYSQQSSVSNAAYTQQSSISSPVYSNYKNYNYNQ